MNRTDIKYISQWTSFPLPVASFKKDKEIKPKAIPSVMLTVNGIIIIVKKAGMASVKSSQLMRVTSSSDNQQ